VLKLITQYYKKLESYKRVNSVCTTRELYSYSKTTEWRGWWCTEAVQNAVEIAYGFY